MASTLSEAVEALKSGGVVVFPTETVYGLGGDATNPKAVARIYALKNRPANNPLIIHCHSLTQLGQIAHLTPTAQRLARHFLPAPLTMVLPLKANAPITPEALAGLTTVAVRIPAHPIAQALLQRVNVPLAAPSANPSGRLSPTLPENALLTADATLADGSTAIGVESTILDLTDATPTILRLGAITQEELAPLIPNLKTHPQNTAKDGTANNTAKKVKAAGMLARHYSPLLPLRLGANRFNPDEAALGFGNNATKGKARAFLNLSPQGNLKQAATNFYAMLARLERTPKATCIAVSPIPDEGLGRVLNNRLQRATAE